MLRLDSLERSVADLQQENGLLAKCIREISQQAACAEEETQFMRVRNPTCRLSLGQPQPFESPGGGAHDPSATP